MKLWVKHNKYWVMVDGIIKGFSLYETREAWMKDYLYNKINN